MFWMLKKLQFALLAGFIIFLFWKFLFSTFYSDILICQCLSMFISFLSSELILAYINFIYSSISMMSNISVSKEITNYHSCYMSIVKAMHENVWRVACICKLSHSSLVVSAYVTTFWYLTWFHLSWRTFVNQATLL